MSKSRDYCIKQKDHQIFRRFAKNMVYNLQKLVKLINESKMAKKFFFILINCSQVHKKNKNLKSLKRKKILIKHFQNHLINKSLKRFNKKQKTMRIKRVLTIKIQKIF